MGKYVLCICIALHMRDLNSPSISVWIQSFNLDCVPLGMLFHTYIRLNLTMKWELLHKIGFGSFVFGKILFQISSYSISLIA